MFTTEDKKFLANCICTIKDIYNIIREYRHSYDADANEYMQLKSILYNLNTNSLNFDIKQFRDHLLDVLDFILDNKLKEFPSEDNRHKVWNSIYDCIRKVYFE